MKKNYFLIVGILILLFVGGYFGVQKFLDNGDEAVVEKKILKKKIERKTNQILRVSLRLFQIKN